MQTSNSWSSSFERMEFNPTYPFIYYPSSDFNSLQKTLKRELINIASTDSDNAIFFNKKCSQVLFDNTGISSGVRYNVGEIGKTKFLVKFELAELLIEGNKVDSTVQGDRCYIAIFP